MKCFVSFPFVHRAYVLCASFAALSLFTILPVFGQAVISETSRTFTTYPYSDPTPVALLAPQQERPSYPYFRWDGYTDKALEKDWKLVTLENPYISLSVLPEVGGKIWGATEKSTGREFIYTNKVLKFRDIAMRGAWTSGGIEFNFGILGHVPTTATPVDYLTCTLPDGSVSCYVASYEWVTGAWWMVDINLPPDKAYFTTSVTWYNASNNLQSCYQWMNAAYSVRGDAEFVYPGNASISHSGDWDTYPVNKLGKDISWYKNIDFGNSMSVHVLGAYSNFYGIYWHDSDFGSAHMAEHADKLGMKYFIWSTARSGAIWENLLTDADGQYIEQQSGRMFCQPDEHCATTPFQHTALQPAQTDTWTEYWFPVKDIGGVKQTSTLGSLNVTRLEDGTILLGFCPLQAVNTDLLVYAGDSLVTTLPLKAEVLQKWEQKVSNPLLSRQGTLRVETKDMQLVYSERTQDNLTDRPLEQPKDINHNSVYELYSQGYNWLCQKRYPEAEQYLKQAIGKDSYFVPALTALATVYNEQGRFDEALTLCRTALAVNTYDGPANYQYAVASLEKGQLLHAKDGFAMAAKRDLNLRSAALLQLTDIAMREKNLLKAEQYAAQALTTNNLNLDAQIRLAAISRIKGNKKEAQTTIEAVLKQLPLYQPARFEAALLGLMTMQQFKQGVQCEMKDEVFLQLADNYSDAELYDEAEQVLNLAGGTIAAYHRAYLAYLRGDKERATALLREAQLRPADYVFPHRLSTMRIMQWADKLLPAWQNKYYEGLVLLGLQRAEEALKLLLMCEQADYAPLFLTRATLQNGEDKLKSLLRSESLQQSWRCGRELIDYYLTENLLKKAVGYGKKYHKLYPGNYYISVLYADALCRDGRFSDCIRLLGKTKVLPYEGATEGHDIYRDAYLGMARHLLQKGKYNEALEAVNKARLWPENLGVGKPYDHLIDSSKEDALEAEIKKHIE